MPEENQAKESLFSISVALFIIPAYIYLCAYFYEKGICDYYGIPTDFIQVDLVTNLYYSSTILFMFLVVYFLPHYFIYSIFYNKVLKDPTLYPFVAGNTLCIIVISFMVRYRTRELEWAIDSWIYGSYFLLVNVLALWVRSYFKEQMKNRSYNDIASEWRGQVKISIPILDQRDVFDFGSIFTSMTKYQRHILQVLVILIGVSFYIGRAEAYQREAYPTSGDLVLLRKYGDSYIAKKYNVKQKTLSDSLFVLASDEAAATRLVVTKTGHLTNGTK